MSVQVSLATVAMVTTVLFLAALARSSLGFGDALIAMPALVLVTNVYTATAVVALSSASVAIAILWNDWRLIEFGSAKRFVAAGIAGIACGLWLLSAAPENLVKRILSIVVILYGLYNLLSPRLFSIRSTYWDYGFGFIAGVLGGAYNTKGPAIVIFGTLRRWPSNRFRATLQGYSFPLSVLVLVAHGTGGLWTSPVLQLYVVAFPFILFAVWLGSKVNRRFSPDKFRQYVYMALIVLGLALL